MLFEGIKKLKVSARPALENLVTADATTAGDQPAAPKQPPMRFGAVKILLEPDPWDSVIMIAEVPNAANTNDYHVFINGPIRGSGAYYAEFMTLLETLDESSTVVVRIASPGGSLYTGSMIASGLSKTRAKTVAIACGVVASAAAFIWSHAKVREVKDNAVIMFHMSSHGDYGNSEKIKITAENIVRYVKETCIDPMVEQGIVTADESETMIDRRRDVLIDATTMRSRLEKFNAKTAQ